MEVGVAEASAWLGVSPQRVRQLAQEGLLPARRLGGRWVFDTEALDRRIETRRVGRPLSPRVAWGLIGLLESGEAPDLDPAERSRLRSRLRSGPELGELAQWCRNRSHVHWLAGHRSAPSRLLHMGGAVPTGASAPGHDVLDLGSAEVYLSADDAKRAISQLHLHPADPASANAVIRIPRAPCWPFPDGRAGPVTVALDLWDAFEPRSRRAARRLYAAALEDARFEPTGS
ncbi:MAG: helix-turn-helix domain-containing protein [Acidimicrobiia bacterium]